MSWYSCYYPLTGTVPVDQTYNNFGVSGSIAACPIGSTGYTGQTGFNGYLTIVTDNNVVNLTPASTILNLIGSNGMFTTAANFNTITLANLRNVSAYVVGPGPTSNDWSDFPTISSALNAASAYVLANPGAMANIYVKPGVYSEGVMTITQSGISFVASQPAAKGSAANTVIIGNIVAQQSTLFYGFQFGSQSTSNAVVQNLSGSVVTFQNCLFELYPSSTASLLQNGTTGSTITLKDSYVQGSNTGTLYPVYSPVNGSAATTYLNIVDSDIDISTAGNLGEVHVLNLTNANFFTSLVIRNSKLNWTADVNAPNNSALIFTNAADAVQPMAVYISGSRIIAGDAPLNNFAYAIRIQDNNTASPPSQIHSSEFYTGALAFEVTESSLLVTDTYFRCEYALMDYFVNTASNRSVTFATVTSVSEGYAFNIEPVAGTSNLVLRNSSFDAGVGYGDSTISVTSPAATTVAMDITNVAVGAATGATQWAVANGAVAGTVTLGYQDFSIFRGLASAGLFTAPPTAYSTTP